MTLERLLEMLAAADPLERDEHAYPELPSRLERGEFDDRTEEIGDLMARRFGHPEIQARTFAPLILAALVRRPGVPAEAVRRWRNAFAVWWPAENDLRGWDERLGWLHAIAHGADLAGALGASALLSAEEAERVLELIGQRVTAPTNFRFEQMEEDRVARAVGAILARGDLTTDAATGWLTWVDRLFATAGPGPLPVAVGNALAVLKSVCVIADRAGAPSVADVVAARLHQAFPAYPSIRA